MAPRPVIQSVENKTPVDDDFAKQADGSIIPTAVYTVGNTTLKWKKATANKKNGFVNLIEALGQHEWCVGYAYTEIESIHARETVLRCGSDDGIKIWINGKLVHNQRQACAVTSPVVTKHPSS